MIKDRKIEEFLNDVASSKPTPGGGAIAALTGAEAAGLVEMVCNLTKPYGSLAKTAEEAKKLRGDLLNLADEDVRAFDRVIFAYKLRDNEEIKNSLNRAIEVPEKVKKLSGRVEELAKKVSQIGNKSAISDAKTAVHLAVAAQKSADENIEVNKLALEKF